MKYAHKLGEALVAIWLIGAIISGFNHKSVDYCLVWPYAAAKAIDAGK